MWLFSNILLRKEIKVSRAFVLHVNLFWVSASNQQLMLEVISIDRVDQKLPYSDGLAVLAKILIDEKLQSIRT